MHAPEKSPRRSWLLVIVGSAIVLCAFLAFVLDGFAVLFFGPILIGPLFMVASVAGFVWALQDSTGRSESRAMRWLAGCVGIASLGGGIAGLAIFLFGLFGRVRIFQ